MKTPLRIMLVLAVAACEPPQPAQAPSGDAPLAPASSGEMAAPGGQAGQGGAHALFVQAAACWLGAAWTEAKKMPADERRAAAEKRCKALVVKLFGSEDVGKYNEVLLASPTIVDALGAEMDKRADADAADRPRKAALAKLMRAVAAAQRESNEAHIAASTVKQDLKAHEERETLSKDEVAAVKPLRAYAALDALLKLDAGDLTPEAHAIGVVYGLARMELARGLPKHLKVYAVADTCQLVFGVAPPAVPEDATSKLTPGTWLSYLSDVARAAGHPVPASATIARERDAWAWGGALEGFADKLRADAGKIAPGSEIEAAVRAIIGTLDAEWAEIPTLAANQKAMVEREEKARKK